MWWLENKKLIVVYLFIYFCDNRKFVTLFLFFFLKNDCGGSHDNQKFKMASYTRKSTKSEFPANSHHRTHKKGLKKHQTSSAIRRENSNFKREKYKPPKLQKKKKNPNFSNSPRFVTHI